MKPAFKRVIIESPYAGDVERNVAYARRCLRDSLLRGEAPIASHLLYTQPGVLDDNDPEERETGILAGLAWYGDTSQPPSYGRPAEACIVYADLGITDGMMIGIERASKQGIQIEFRKIGVGDTEGGEQ